MKTTNTTQTTTTTWESEIPPDVAVGVWIRVSKSSDAKTFQLMVVCNVPSGLIFRHALATWDELRAMRDTLDAALNDTYSE